MDAYRPDVVQVDDGEIILKRKNHLWRPEKQDALSQLGYTVQETIGEGTFTKVKRGYSAKHNKDVAIKALAKQKIAGEILKKFLPREIYLHQRLVHPHLVQLIETIESSTHLFIVEEFEPNGDLLDYVNEKRRGHLSEAEGRRIFKQMIDVVTYLHGVGVVHRDLKLDNFLLDEDFNIKLTDFGFARLLNRNDQCCTPCGSYVYTAPEVLDGDQYDGYKADIWSLGVCLYTMVCGCFPFSDLDVSTLRESMAVHKIHFLKSVTQECRDIILCLLSVRASSRPMITQLNRFEWMCMALTQESDLVVAAPSTASILHRSPSGMNLTAEDTEHGFSCDQKSKERRSTLVSDVLHAVALKHCEEATSDFDLNDPTSSIGVTGPAGRRLSLAIATEVNNANGTRSEVVNKATGASSRRPSAAAPRKQSIAMYARKGSIMPGGGDLRKGSLILQTTPRKASLAATSSDPIRRASISIGSARKDSTAVSPLNHRRLSMAASGKTPLNSHRRGSLMANIKDTATPPGSGTNINESVQLMDEQHRQCDNEMRQLKHATAAKVASQARRASIAQQRKNSSQKLPVTNPLATDVRMHVDPKVREALDKWKAKCQAVVQEVAKDESQLSDTDLKSGSWVMA